jgi:hypothetical protein
VVDVDAVVTDAERAERVPLRGEILVFGRNSGIAHQECVHPHRHDVVEAIGQGVPQE